MDEQEIFYWIENKTFSKLSDLQKEILKGSWEGKSYQCIANSYNYNLQYVKDVGYRLWHSLAESCDERITKKNFPVKIEKIINASLNTVNNHQDWGDAPDVPIFFGRNQELGGLDYHEGKEIFQAIGNFAGTEGEWQTLIEFYNGNPLILELVAHHIRAVFGGDIRQFLVEGKYMFDDLQILLNRHLKRLSSAEQEIIDCLATNWQPVSLAELKVKLRSLDTKKRITDILQSLTRRLIINTSVMGYTLQPMLREYINYEKNPRLIVTSTKVVSIKTKC